MRIRDKAVENRAEAMTHARMLDELFELETLSHNGDGAVPAVPEGSDE